MGSKVKVIFDYDATQPDELTIKVGDIINDVKKQPGGWWEGILNGRKGVFPDNFVEDYSSGPAHEPPKGPKPGGGKVSDMQNKIGAQIKVGPPPAAKSTKPKQMAVVLFEYKPEQPDELELMEGDQVEILRMAEEGWWEGVLKGRSGMFPSNFVKLMDSPPAQPAGPAAGGPGPNAYPLPGIQKQNDIGNRPPPGGRPPAEKPKMAPPPANDPSNPPPQLPKRNRGTRAKVIYSYHAQNDDELTLMEGQVVNVVEQNLEDPGWWKGEVGNRVGVFPDNFVEILPEDEPSSQPAAPPQRLPDSAAPGRGGSTVRANKPPPQPPQEMEQPAKLPPRPAGFAKTEVADVARAPMPVATKPKPEPELPKAQAPAPQHMMVNGVDDKVVASLREEMEAIKASMVPRESFELLQRELKASREALDSYKKESNKKLIDLMKEIDEEKKLSTQNSIELARIRKMVEDKY